MTLNFMQSKRSIICIFQSILLHVCTVNRPLQSGNGSNNTMRLVMLLVWQKRKDSRELNVTTAIGLCHLLKRNLSLIYMKFVQPSKNILNATFRLPVCSVFCTKKVSQRE
eukprot:Pompholyxophrys_punicea_v1_NODE_1519_length_666_cov_1.423895.p1 type:complete len:110 gc:universal NODE_1519_length_666_cov_1.423895:559-230(-)